MKQLRHISLSILLFFLLRDYKLVEGATFNFVNNCGGPVWPGILSNAGSGKLETTGFQLPPGGSRTIMAPTGWSGRFWGRTGCSFDSSGRGSCSTGDCGSNQVECNGAGANPPATLAEFTLASGPSTQDFYDVSLVDGYNLPIMVQPSGSCMATGCTVDLNQKCPAELRVANGDACKSACEAFNKPEYCCSGAYGNPNTCKPTMYSQLFKSACPRSYSYAYDDPTSTFTCTGGADYIVTFCPGSTSSSSSQKSSRDSSTSSTSSTSTPQFSGGITSSGPGNNNDDSNASNNNGVMLQDNSWLASLATGDSASAPTKRPKYPLLVAFSFSLVLLL